MKTAPAQKPDPSTWPKGVDEITIGSMARLGVGQDGQLYWDGRPVQTESRIRFNWVQTLFAIVIGLATIIGGVGAGVNEGFDFGCKVHWWSAGCSK